jgi:alpha-L-fucosidase
MSSAPHNRRAFLSALGAAGAATALSGTADVLRSAPAAAAIPGPTSYSPTWESVDQHPPAPEWFQDAKFGIYFHWGVFSVPAFDNEWYPRNMYIDGSAANTHHKSVFGDPAAWPYHNFIDGARDKNGNYLQFAPKLKSAGGNFDPVEWAQLFADAGAKFAGPVAEHHDGFSMWNFTGFYDHVPAQSTTTLKKLYGQLGPAAENQLWYDKLKEVIDGFQPDILWQDFNLSAVDEAQRLKFLAYYYNRAVAWDKEVVATYKDGFNTRARSSTSSAAAPPTSRTRSG